MLLKIFGSLIVFTACGFLGFYLSAECKKRPLQLREMQSLLNMFENQICFLSDVITEAFERLVETSHTEVGLFFADTVNELKTGTGLSASEAWKQAVSKNIKKTALKKEDEIIIQSFGDMLGSSDIDGQVNNIRLTVGRLKLQEQKAEEERSRYESMYRSLGVLGGLSLVIIFI